MKRWYVNWEQIQSGCYTPTLPAVLATFTPPFRFYEEKHNMRLVCETDTQPSPLILAGLVWKEEV